MLLIVDRFGGLDFDRLAEIYGFKGREAVKFYEYLSSCFFRQKGAVYCLWLVDGQYCSALRLEPYKDGLLLTGLETAPHWRRRGYAQSLMGAALGWAEGMGHRKIYSHIRFDNRASLAVHQRLGFRKMLNHAVLLDGTVSSKIGTYLYTGTSV